MKNKSFPGAAQSDDAIFAGFNHMQYYSEEGSFIHVIWQTISVLLRCLGGAVCLGVVSSWEGMGGDVCSKGQARCRTLPKL